MSLLTDIQKEAVDSNASVATALRRAKLLASRLKDAGFAKWVGYELNGYPQRRSEVPDYRIVACTAFGNFMAGNMVAKLPIPTSVLPAKLRDWGECCYFSQAIDSIEAMAHKASAGDSHGIVIHWPPEYFQYAEEAVHGNCIGAWLSVNPAELFGIIGAVRNRLLDFTLAVESENPEAGEADIRSTPIDPSKVSQMVQTFIYGGNNSISAGGAGFTQSIVVQPYDLASLRSALSAAGIMPEEIDELTTDLARASTPTQKQSAADGWLGRTARRAVAAGRAFVVEVSAKAIAEYLRPPTP
jgi:hypothetical protein